MSGLVEAVLFAVLFSAGMGLFWRYTRREPTVSDGAAWLRHGPAVAVLGWVMILMGVGIGAGVAVDETARASPFALGLGAVVSLGALAVGVWFVVSHRHDALLISESGIEERGIGRSRSVRWVDVSSVRFNALSGYLTVRGAIGERVRISAMLSGSERVVPFLVRHVEAPADRRALDRFMSYRMTYGAAVPKR